MKEIHHYFKLAIELKNAGFPQELYVRDSVYLPEENEVITNNPIIIPKDTQYVRIPSLSALISKLEKNNISYTVSYQNEKYTISADSIQYTDESIWVVLVKLWLAKGK